MVDSGYYFKLFKTNFKIAHNYGINYFRLISYNELNKLMLFICLFKYIKIATQIINKMEY